MCKAEAGITHSNLGALLLQSGGAELQVKDFGAASKHLRDVGCNKY